MSLFALTRPKIVFTVAVILTGLAYGQTKPSNSVTSDYPTKPVRLIVPYPAGGGADFWGRLVAEKLASALGQPVVVDNIPGAGGNNGTAVAAKATPDGYTLLLGSIGPLVVHPYTYNHLSFDPAKDFVPISLLESSPILLVVNPGVQASSMQELIAMAKASPGSLTFGSNGNGSPEQIAGELFNQKAGVDIRHVPFDGAGPARKDVVKGGVSIMFDPCKAAMTLVKEGKVRALGVASSKRLSALPDVPTFGEAGVNGFDLRIWTGILVPTGTPKEIVARLSRATQEILSTPEIEKTVAEYGGELGHTTTPEQFGSYIQAQRDKWSKLAAETDTPKVDKPI
jgi:tripartite-type tricarboxylate transporter receptor subunit TctC